MGQFVVFEANKHFYSPYPTEKLGTKYTFASDKFKSYSKPVAEIDGKKITYGPYKDIAPFSASERVRFHFQFHVPYLTMTEVVRDIEISHYGNVRIEESFLLSHDGAKLKGAYEVGMYDRYEHIMGSMGTASSDPSSVRSFKANLPSGAKNVYYIDRIGNVSTSNFRQGKKKKNSVLEMRPRYPLYGGWKTDFLIGYDVPSADLISIDRISRVHTLNVSFAIPFKEPVTDLLITRIALPEGAHDVKVICPYDIMMEAESKRFTYLDTMIGGGRPLITFSKTNVINLHNLHFQITYVYDSTRIYYKPILIICTLFGVFAFTMFISRISPSLSVDTGNANGNDNMEQMIERLMSMKANGDKILKELERVLSGSDDVRMNALIAETMKEIKDLMKNNKKGRKGKNDAVDLRANIEKAIRSLQNNL